VAPRLGEDEHSTNCSKLNTDSRRYSASGSVYLANESDPEKSGGADRDRTGDPLVANQVLSQLSYSPTTALSKLQRFEVSAAKP
jgi:hypothetical protein